MMIMYRSAPVIERTATEPKSIPAIAPLERLEDDAAAAIWLGDSEDGREGVEDEDEEGLII
jgi:hypothetical protein